MKKILLSLVLILIFSGASFAGIVIPPPPIDIDMSNSYFEVLDSHKFRIRNITTPTFPGIYQVEFIWNPNELIFEPTAVAVDNSLANQIVGEWLGECSGGNQIFRFNNSMTWIESDDGDGGGAGNYTVNGNLLCLEITYANDLGCSPDTLGTICSEISISNNVLTFHDLNPGTGDMTYIKQ